MGNIKIERLTQRIKERAGQLLLSEMNDPRMGFVTVTKVNLTRDLRFCTIFVSVYGSNADRTKVMRALEDGRGYLQGKIGGILRTRTIPKISFQYDESVEGSIRVSKILKEIEREREERNESPPAVGDREGSDDPDEGES